MSQYSSPITKETFPQFWRYAVRKQYWSKKKSAARNLVVSICQLLFFFAFMILSYGILYTLSQGLVRSFLDRIPAIVNHWLKFEAFLFAGAVTNGDKLIRMALLLYGVPLAAGAIAALAVVLFYHPAAPRLPEDAQSQARELWVISQHIKSASMRKINNVFGFCALFYGMIAAGMVVFFLLYNVQHPQVAATLSSNLGQSSLYFTLGVIAAVVCYALFNIPMAALIRVVMKSYVPDAFYDNTENYYQQVRTQTGAAATAAILTQEAKAEANPEPQQTP